MKTDLNEECWDLISEYATKLNATNFGEFRGACKIALTTPEIIKAANLYTHEEMIKNCRAAYERAIAFYGVPPLEIKNK